MRKNCVFEVQIDHSLDVVKFMGNVFNKTDFSIDGFTIYRGRRLIDPTSSKFKNDFIGIKGDILIGSFSKIKGLRENIILYNKSK